MRGVDRAIAPPLACCNLEEANNKKRYVNKCVSARACHGLCPCSPPARWNLEETYRKNEMPTSVRQHA